MWGDGTLDEDAWLETLDATHVALEDRYPDTALQLEDARELMLAEDRDLRAIHDEVSNADVRWANNQAR